MILVARVDEKFKVNQLVSLLELNQYFWSRINTSKIRLPNFLLFAHEYK